MLRRGFASHLEVLVGMDNSDALAFFFLRDLPDISRRIAAIASPNDAGRPSSFSGRAAFGAVTVLVGEKHVQVGKEDYFVGADGLLMPVRNLDLQRVLDGAQMPVHGAAQVGQAGIIGGREKVTQNQADNSSKEPQ